MHTLPIHYFESTPKEVDLRFLRCSVEINAYSLIKRLNCFLFFFLVYTQRVLQLQEEKEYNIRHFIISKLFLQLANFEFGKLFAN